jgi:superfamily I DNA/RNA helicase
MSEKMKEAEKIFGPPGTGKTDRLIKKVSHLINEKGIKPEDICYITFTNKGIDEVRERLKVTKKTEGYESFATIHGLCNGFLKGRESRLVSEGDFEYWAKREDGDLKREFNGDLENNFIIQVYNLHRVANISLREAFTRLNERNYKWNRLEEYVRSWELYKQNNKLHDFTDQILNALDVNRFKEYKAVFLDEAQDSSWCQWQVIKKIMDKGSVEYLYIAGDDDQAIFDWNGGEVKYFLSNYTFVCKPVILQKSYRLTNQHISFAEQISSDIKHRQQKKYFSDHAHSGEIHYTDRFSQIPVKDGESWTIMVTGAPVMSEIKDLLIRHRAWFTQTTAKGYVHYPVGAKIIAALKCFFDLQKDKYVTRSNLLSYRTLVKPKNFKPKQWEELDPDQLYKAQDLQDMFGLDFSVDWKEAFANVNNPEWNRKKKYIMDCVDQGVDIFDKKPKIKLCTIHSMKGGEDENTVVVGNMEMPFHKKYKSFDHVEKDTIKRMFYVACTRAKQRMYIYMCPSLKFRFDFDTVYRSYKERKEVA